MIDFPNNPAIDATFTASNGVVYKWNGTTWTAIATSGAVPDAPDATIYGRQKGAWVALANHDKIKIYTPDPAAAGQDIMVFDTARAGQNMGIYVNTPVFASAVPFIGFSIGAIKKWQWNFADAEAILYKFDNAVPAVPTAALTINRLTGFTKVSGTLAVTTGNASDGTFQLAADATYRYVSFGVGWTWRWASTSGTLDWIANNIVKFTINPSGQVNMAIQGTGIVQTGVQGDGSTYSLQSLVVGNPAWATCDFRTRHQNGVWAGWEYVANNGTQVRFTMSNGQSFGTVQALAFEVQSDERIKTLVAPLPRYAGFINIRPISWKWPVPVVGPDDPPIYPDLREKWGFSAQNLTTALPLAVNGSVEAEETAGIDPIPILAVTVLEVHALWAEIASLKAEIAALKGTP